jgi:hypothetical protein
MDKVDRLRLNVRLEETPGSKSNNDVLHAEWSEQVDWDGGEGPMRKGLLVSKQAVALAVLGVPYERFFGKFRQQREEFELPFSSSEIEWAE